MTLLTFELKRPHGRLLFYPKNAEAVAICAVNARAGLLQADLLTLEAAGFTIRVDHGPAENIDWRPRA